METNDTKITRNTGKDLEPMRIDISSSPYQGYYYKICVIRDYLCMLLSLRT